MGIELRHLRYFLAVIEELHFGRAAARLEIAQPPLSRAIRKLEDELGVQLLRRTSRVVTPTDAGRVFADEARRVLASFELAAAEARRAGTTTPALRFGCILYLSIERVHRFFDALRERHPAVQPEVSHLSALEQLERLGRGVLDFGIFHHPGDLEGIELEPLFAGEQMEAFLPVDHPLAAREVVTPDDLLGEIQLTWARAVNPGLWDCLVERVEDAGFRFRDRIEVGRASARDLMLAVAAGQGVAIASPSFHTQAGKTSIVARRALQPPVYMPDTTVAWRADPPRHLEPAIAAVRAAANKLRLATEWERETAGVA